MPPRSATRKASAKRKKPASSTANAATGEAENELTTPGVKTEAELADAVDVKDEENGTEQLVQVEVSNPNSVKIDGDPTDGAVLVEDKVVSVSSELMVKKEAVVENSELDHVNLASNQDGEVEGTIGTEEGSCGASEKVDEGEQGVGAGKIEDGVKEGKQGVGMRKNEDGVVCIDACQSATVAAQEETADVGVDDLIEHHDKNTTLLVEDDENGGEKVAEIISVVEASNSKAPCEDDTALVVKDGFNEGRNVDAEITHAQESAQADSIKAAYEKDSAQADSIKAPCENNTALADSTKTPCENNTILADSPKKHSKNNTAPAESPKTPYENITSLADSTTTPYEDNTALAIEDDSKWSVDDEEIDYDSEGDDKDNEGDEVPSLSVQDSATDKKKDKGIEIYVGRLDKDTVEDDLINVFQKFGELKSTRIVRNPTTQKSKGFAFVRFASVQQAKHALSELKDGVEVRGKHVKISASQDNDTLYLGNISKTWTKVEVLQQLKNYGIEHIEEIHLPDDPKNDGKIKGFAFIEFSTHSDAIIASQRLQKPDAVFGRDISAKVAFTYTPLHPGDEVLSQITRVYVEGLTKAWNEEKLKEICKQYGEIVKIDFLTKHKVFGFVTFTSHESARACVEGINNGGIEGEVKIKASFAKPQVKSRLQKQGFRGGFKVEKEGEASSLKKEGESSKEAKSPKMKGNLNSQQGKRKMEASAKRKIKAHKGLPQKKGSGGGSKVEKQSEVSLSKKEGESSKEAESSKIKSDLNSQQAERKRKASSEQKLNAPPELRDGGQGSQKKSKNGTEGQNSKTTPKAGTSKGKKASKYEGREDGGIRGIRNKKPFKKQKGNIQGRERDNPGNLKRGTHIRQGRDDYRNSTRQREVPYTTNYAPPSAYHLVPASMSTSTRHYTEMEPHAGYIEPASARQGRPYSGYVQPVVRTHSQHHTIYVEPAAGSQSQPHPRYVDRSIVTQSHRGYIEAPVGAQVRSYGGHRQPAVVQLAHDPYSPELSRVVRHYDRGTSGPAYIGGQSLSASQVPSHSSYAGYQASSSYFRGTGTYGTHRSYY